jgi:hypothetical protein
VSEQINMQEVLKHLNALESMGCAVAVFTPEELGNANPKRVTDNMIEAGWFAIDTLQDSEADEEEEA